LFPSQLLPKIKDESKQLTGMDSRDRIKRSKENIHGAMLSAFILLLVFILTISVHPC
jgi:uncharacterized membrane protein